MNLQGTVIGAISIAFVGGILGRAARYLITYVVARGMGAEVLGTFTTGLVVLQLGSMISRAGLGVAIQKQIPIHLQENSPKRITGDILSALSVSLILGITVSTVLYVATIMFDAVPVVLRSSIVKILILGIPLYAVMWVGSMAARGFKQVRYSVYVRDIIHSGLAVSLIAIVSFFAFEGDFISFVYVVSTLIAAIFSIFYLRQLGAFDSIKTPEFDIFSLLKVSLPLSLALTSQYLISWTDIIMLTLFVESTEIGWYQAAFQTALILQITIASVNAIFPSVSSELYSDGNVGQLKELFATTTRWITYFSVLGASFIIIYSQEIMSQFGPSFRNAAPILCVLVVGQVVATASGPVSYLLAISGNERIETINTVSFSILNVILNYFLIIEYGVLGAAISTALSISLLNLLRSFEAWLFLRVRIQPRRYWKGGLAYSVAVSIMLLADQVFFTSIATILAIGIISLTVFVVIIATLGLEDPDKRLIESFMN